MPPNILMDEQKHQDLVNYKLEQITLRLDKIDKKLDDGVSRPEIDALQKRILDLEETNKWLNRLVISAVILALIGGIIVLK